MAQLTVPLAVRKYLSIQKGDEIKNDVVNILLIGTREEIYSKLEDYM